MNAKLIEHLQILLSRDSGKRMTPQLCVHAEKLCKQSHRIATGAGLKRVPDANLLETACYALQLPMRDLHTLPVGQFGQINLRGWCQQAVEQFVETAGKLIEERPLDRVIRVMMDIPNKTPDSDEAKILADAINLDDFGISGLINAAVRISRGGQGVATLLDGFHKREEYGYWAMRFRDGFHFACTRQIAERRHESMQQVLQYLTDEWEQRI